MFLHQLSAGAAKISVSLVAAPANKGAHRIGALSFNLGRLLLATKVYIYDTLVGINITNLVLGEVFMLDRLRINVHSLPACKL